MTLRSPEARRAQRTIEQIEKVLREPQTPVRAPAANPPVAGSAMYVSIAAQRYRDLVQAALSAVHNYSQGRPFPLSALVEELRECGLLLDEDGAR